MRILVVNNQEDILHDCIDDCG